jgi:hypothetical protein
VQLVKSDEEKAKDEARAAEESAAYYVEIGGTERGPFSVIQLRELASAGRLNETPRVRLEGQKRPIPLSDVLL